MQEITQNWGTARRRSQTPAGRATCQVPQVNRGVFGARTLGRCLIADICDEHTRDALVVGARLSGVFIRCIDYIICTYRALGFHCTGCLIMMFTRTHLKISIREHTTYK